MRTVLQYDQYRHGPYGQSADMRARWTELGYVVTDDDVERIRDRL
jgi:hypothetical protein